MKPLLDAEELIGSCATKPFIPSQSHIYQTHTPPKTNMTMEKQP